MPRDKNIFTLNPTSLDMKRSVFSRNSQHKTSFNLGRLIPIYLDEILPGDTVSLDLAQVIRMSTPIAPIMDNLYADVYAFFVPNRLVWSNWQQFCGEADTMAWTQTGTYTIPTQNVGTTSTSITPSSIGSYFGLPLHPAYQSSGADQYLKPKILNVNELPLRAYYKIYNDWFRDENNIAPVIYSIGNSSNYNILYANECVKVSRFHDLFSSALPAPQKGGSVSIPLGGEAPIIPGTAHDFQSGTFATFRFENTNFTSGNTYAMEIKGDGSKNGLATVNLDAATGTTTSRGMTGTNLVADLRNATAATINQLRLAFQVQKLLEKDARGGTRYIELLRAHFGVTSPDARLQRSEYLAGHRFRLNVDQVLATADSGASGSTDLGQTGAYSRTSQAGSLFTKSFVEHGMLMIFVVVRQDHTYSQGLEKYWLKQERFDFYYPVLANIGEVPIYKSEIDIYNRDRDDASDNGTAGEASGVFGYQEAWYEYRFKPSRTSGYMNPCVVGSLNYWTLGDVYAAVPGLNQTFLEESPDFLDRALKVQSSTMHQFIADFYFKAKFSRVMPLYSVPGLIDHH